MSDQTEHTNNLGGREQGISQAINEFKNTKSQYAFDPMWADSEKARKALEGINRLPEADRILIILYAELQSVIKVAKMLGVGKSTIHNEITRIRKTLKNDIGITDC